MINYYCFVFCFVLLYQFIIITSCHNSGIIMAELSKMNLAALDSNHFLPDSPPPFYTVAETLISCVANTHSRVRSVDKRHMLVYLLSKPMLIFNMDEKGISVVHKPGKVVGRKMTSGERESAITSDDNIPKEESAACSTSGFQSFNCHL